jgi:hypothetical protein
MASQASKTYPGDAMQITSILDACQSILEEQDEPQSSYWLASQMMEMRLWRASEADVRDALAKELEERGESSRFMRVAEDEFALRAWIKEKGAVGCNLISTLLGERSRMNGCIATPKLAYAFIGNGTVHLRI